jgi:hypothetical protein
MTLQGHLNLCLVNRLDNGYTWSFNNAAVKDQVLDLVWAEQSIAPNVHLDIDMAGRFNSDYAILLFMLPCTREQGLS